LFLSAVHLYLTPSFDVTTLLLVAFSFLYNPPAPAPSSTLSLHDALPIFPALSRFGPDHPHAVGHDPRMPHHHAVGPGHRPLPDPDRKSTRLNSSHVSISYAVFCLKKKKNNKVFLMILKTDVFHLFVCPI